MGRDLFANVATTTVSSGGTTAPAALTTQSWTVASSTLFPAANNAAVPPTQFRITDPAAPSEVILVTHVSGTTWSVTRGWEGTTPVAHTAGFTVNAVVTANYLTDVGGIIVVKAADESVTSSTTVQNDDHFIIPVEANSSYILDGFVHYDGAFGAGSLKMDWTIPSGATMYWSPFGNQADQTTQKLDSNASSATSAISVGTYGTGGNHTCFAPLGYITTSSTAGNLQFRWAQNSSNGTATTVYSGSWFRLRRLS